MADFMTASWMFYQKLKPWIEANARRDEVLIAQLRSESSDFVRFNQGLVRQSGRVERAQINLRLINTVRRVSSESLVTVNPAEHNVLETLVSHLDQLRTINGDMPEDPWVDWYRQPWSLEQRHEIAPARIDEVILQITRSAQGIDLVGFLMLGPMSTAVLSSIGIQLWHSASRCSFEASVYAPAPAAPDKAVKFLVAGETFDADAVNQAIRSAARQTQVLQKPPIELTPDHYRVWLAPAATGELLGMLQWGGFSASALKSGQSPLQALAEQKLGFSPLVSLLEAPAKIYAPLFDSDGAPRASGIALVGEGKLLNQLVSARSALEFGLVPNGAASHEGPEGLAMSPGELAAADAWSRLGTGISVSNLWYLNFAEKQRCRVTGMTRFASVWVEDGEAVAPIKPMRFDDSMFELLGPQLEAVEDISHLLPDTDSYDWRSWGATSAPGLLIRKMCFAL